MADGSSKTETKIEEEIIKTESSSSSSDALAKGISSLVTTVIQDFDSTAENTFNSQDHLSSSIDRLTKELDQLLEDAPLPFIMQHASKISLVRKRVSSLNAVLKSIERRVDNMDRALSVSLGHENSKRKSSATLNSCSTLNGPRPCYISEFGWDIEYISMFERFEASQDPES